MRNLIVALLVTATLAGCTTGSGEGAGATAMQHLDVAEAEATTWNQDAALSGIFTVEFQDRFEEAEDLPSNWTSDETPGDGRAPAWAYGFTAGDGESLLVVVDADGQVQQVDEEGGGPNIVQNWTIDSDEATRIIRDNNGSYADRVAAPDANVMMGLEQDEDENGTERPIWFVGIFDREAEFSLYLVDAETGEYLGSFDFEDFDFDFELDPLRPSEYGEERGMLTLLAPEASHTFTLEREDHPELFVTFRVDQPSPGSTVTMLVTSPEGEEKETTWSTSGTAQVEFPEPAAGQWDAEVQLESGAAVNYRLTWCAPGFHVDVGMPGGPAQACDR